MNKMEKVIIQKRNKPSFIRYNSEYLRKLSSNWRKQKGLHNKVRLKKKGHPSFPSIGYGSPKEIRNLFDSKYKYKLINSEKDLENLNEKYVILSSKLGLKKKLIFLNKLKSLDIKILNMKDVEKFIKDSEEKLKQNKDKKKIESKKREEVKEKPVEKKELTKEEKEEQEKLEKKKVLEKGL